MAVARMVCSECGGLLSPGDVFCPQCGARIEGVAPKREEGKSRPCPACGHLNRTDAVLCESCGAKMSAGTAKRQPSRPSREKAKGNGSRYEPWQIVSAVAVIVLVAFLLYTQLSEEKPRVSSVTAGTGPSSPMTSAPVTHDIEPLRNAVAASPNAPGPLLALGNALFDNGQYFEAIDAYKRYLAITPSNPDARVDMGICYYQLGLADSSQAPRMFAEALKAMETAYKGNPTHQPAAFNLGIVNLYRGDMEASNRWFRRAVEINKDSELGDRARKILEQHHIPQ